MIKLIIKMQRGAEMYDGKVVSTQNQASPALIADLEAMAYDMGVKGIRYVRVPDHAIFITKGIPHEFALVFTVEMDKASLDTSPSFESQMEVMRGYKDLAVISTRLSDYMRKNGLAAYPGTSLGGITDYNLLAELAGLGVNGYHGMLITPGEGTRLRINTIYTNIENLPIARAEGNEHLCVRDFCAMCKKCVRGCPVDAIFQEPVPRGDNGGRQRIDHDLCRDYFAEFYGCAICLAQCPFSQVGYDKIMKHFKGNPTAPQLTIPVNGGGLRGNIETTEKVAAR